MKPDGESGLAPTVNGCYRLRGVSTLSVMKLTLDHNVVIDFVKDSPRVTRLREILKGPSYQAYVVEIGGSEMRKGGVQPKRYDLFEQLLSQAGLAELPRLAPMAFWNVTFWDHSLWCDNTMSDLAKRIEDILFGNSKPIDIANQPENSPQMEKWLNRICDIQSMWCHLHYRNDIFVTSDDTFHKETKLPRLLDLGARQIAKPDKL